MALQCPAIEIEQVKLFWPSIASNLSSELAEQLEKYLNFTENDDENEEKFFAVVNICLNQKPNNFKEYAASAMFATMIELVKVPSPLFTLHKKRLMTHVFSTFSQTWANDMEKVLAVAESIWKVTTNPTNINHIVIQIHGYNQFTFDVAIYLLIGALGSLVTVHKSDKLPLLSIHEVLEDFMMLSNAKNRAERQIMQDFLKLFQSFQRLMRTPFAEDCLADVSVMEFEQLKDLKTYLHAVIEDTHRCIRQQIDLDQNGVIIHFAHLVLSNMDNILQV